MSTKLARRETADAELTKFPACSATAHVTAAVDRCDSSTAVDLTSILAELNARRTALAPGACPEAEHCVELYRYGSLRVRVAMHQMRAAQLHAEAQRHSGDGEALMDRLQLLIDYEQTHQHHVDSHQELADSRPHDLLAQCRASRWRKVVRAYRKARMAIERLATASWSLVDDKERQTLSTLIGQGLEEGHQRSLSRKRCFFDAEDTFQRGVSRLCAEETNTPPSVESALRVTFGKQMLGFAQQHLVELNWQLTTDEEFQSYLYQMSHQ